MKVLLTFSGGHDTDPQDHGRPVVLVASLKVTLHFDKDLKKNGSIEGVELVSRQSEPTK